MYKPIVIWKFIWYDWCSLTIIHLSRALLAGLQWTFFYQQSSAFIVDLIIRRKAWYCFLSPSLFRSFAFLLTTDLAVCLTCLLLVYYNRIRRNRKYWRFSDRCSRAATVHVRWAPCFVYLLLFVQSLCSMQCFMPNDSKHGASFVQCDAAIEPWWVLE